MHPDTHLLFCSDVQGCPTLQSIVQISTPRPQISPPSCPPHDPTAKPPTPTHPLPTHHPTALRLAAERALVTNSPSCSASWNSGRCRVSPDSLRPAQQESGESALATCCLHSGPSGRDWQECGTRLRGCMARYEFSKPARVRVVAALARGPSHTHVLTESLHRALAR